MPLGSTAILTFVIPLRAPATCESWELTSFLCRRTIQSLVNQTSPDWACILSCSEAPASLPPDDRIHVLQGDYTIPTSFWEAMHDKGEKVRAALTYFAAKVDTPFVMPLDADDLVHRELVAYVEQHADAPHGWIVESGYRVYEGQWPFALKIGSGFHQRCGSSVIARQSDAVSSEAFVRDNPLTLAHARWRRAYAARGTPLTPLEFPCVMQVCGTGENVRDRTIFSRRGLALLPRSRRMTPELQRDFGFGERLTPA